MHGEAEFDTPIRCNFGAQTACQAEGSSRLPFN
jgi:hypothetical protein